VRRRRCPWSRTTRGPRRTSPRPRSWARTVDGAELFVYPGSGHLVSDDSLGEFDEAATRLTLERSIAFLDRCE
jgi:hypothetical protein